MGSLKKSLKRKAFRKAKEVLPDSTVLEIQRRRLEGRKVFGPEPKPGSYAPSTTYAVVSAVYNVEAYLDDYLESLMSQTIDPAALRVIAVDDGSTDASAEVIRSWQERFPGRIDYVRKENGGQASARNLGMSMVEAEWVTFIDPDDFVSRDYFEQVDRVVRGRGSLKMVVCNLVFYREAQRRCQDSHPLRYRFGGEDRFYNVQDDDHPIQLSMSTAFFRIQEIRDIGLKVSERIRPSFEDAHFVNRYLSEQNNGTIVFLSKPKYYYRKRESGTSTLDTSWDSPVKITSESKGCLDLLEKSRVAKGYVPMYVQNAVLYHLSWYFKYFVGHSERSDRYQKRGDGSREAFLEILKEIFLSISQQAIEEAPGSWIQYNWKRALTDRYSKAPLRTHIAYITRIEPKKRRFLLQTADPEIEIFLEGKEHIPRERKIQRIAFFRKRFSTYTSAGMNTSTRIRPSPFVQVTTPLCV